MRKIVKAEASTISLSEITNKSFVGIYWSKFGKQGVMQ